MKKPTLGSTPIKKRSQKGFALVSTILVMSMLLLLGVSMLSMSSVTTRSSNSDKHQEIAEANARLAAMIALGELQKYAGPDQRVTFNASVFDDTPDTPKITGVDNPHWVGVVRTDGFKDDPINTPIIGFKDDALIDRRLAGYDRKDNVLAWLVSGKDLDPQQSYPNQVLLASNGEKDGDVYAPIVDIESNKQKGSYAYWISDESSKVNLALFDPEHSTAPTFSNSESLNKLLVSQAPNLKSYFPNLSDASPSEINKILTLNQTALTSIGHGVDYTSVAAQTRAMIHDVTPFSKSILSDALNGGLKKNLTAYLDSTGGSVSDLGTMKGISDNDTILLSSNRETIGPKFGAIRDWYKLKDSATGSLGSRTLQAQLPNSINNAGVDPTKFTKQAIHPVIASAQYYGNYAYDRTTREVIELVYPKVVLWNPYNIKLQTKGMYIEWDFKMNRICDITYKKTDGTTGTFNANNNYNFGYNRERDYFFYIPPITFEPGEALTFTAPEQGATYKGKGRFMQERKPQLNPLSATADPSELRCYYRNRFGGWATKKIPNEADLDTMTAAYSGTLWNGNGETQTVKLFAAEGNASNPNYSDLGNNSFPKIQQIHLDNYSRGNNGRWMPYYPMGKLFEINEVLNSDKPPKSLIGFGVRFKHFYESFSNRAYGGPLKEPWYYAPIIHSNVRAGRSHRWPSDNIFGVRYSGSPGTSGARAHLYTFGPYAQSRQFREWTDSATLPILSDKGNYISSVFQDNSNLTPSERNTLFDIPAKDIPLFSIASFQHAQLTPYIWDPSYIIGSGYANPNLPLDKSSYSKSERDNRWNTKLAQFRGQNNNVHLRNMVNGNPMVYDIAYETNHGLWDKYFLSGIPSISGNWDGDSWQTGAALPNSNLTINSSVKDSNKKSTLQDFHKAAQALVQRGGFNANSTSVTAWKALLSSFNEIDQPNRLGNKSNNSDLKHPYSRFIVPHSISGESPDVTDSLLWSGHRLLSDEEIERLAQEIVVQVKRRAPFIGLSDFVNRRLLSGADSEAEIALFGTLQAAINNADINANLDGSTNLNSSLPDENEAKNYQYGALYWGGPAFTPYEQLYKTFEFASKSISEAAAATGYMTQADVLQKLGPNLTVRGDTFIIRAYGESKDQSNQVKAKAWCELVVQRSVYPIQPDPAEENLNPIVDANAFGRKFDVISFRWLNQKEFTTSN